MKLKLKPKPNSSALGVPVCVYCTLVYDVLYYSETRHSSYHNLFEITSVCLPERRRPVSNPPPGAIPPPPLGEYDPHHCSRNMVCIYIYNICCIK